MISPEREEVLRGCLEGQTPEERQFARDYCARCFGPPAQPLARRPETFATDYDYEAAVLDRDFRL